MSKTNLKKELKKDLIYLKKMHKIYKEMTDYIGIESKAGNSISSLLEAFEELIYEKHGDNEGYWISYFIYECNFGDDKEVEVDDRKYILDSIDSFIDFFFKEINLIEDVKEI